MSRAATPALRRAVAGALALLCFAFAVHAQSPGCPSPKDIQAPQLFGLWRASFEGQPQPATVLLEKHPEYEDGLYGGINRDGARALLAGGVDDGTLVLTESDDGQRISARWEGKLAPGSCGREVRGIWSDALSEAQRGFVLVKAAPLQ